MYFAGLSQVVSASSPPFLGQLTSFPHVCEIRTCARINGCRKTSRLPPNTARAIQRNSEVWVSWRMLTILTCGLFLESEGLPEGECELAARLEGVGQDERELCAQLLCGVSHPAIQMRFKSAARDRCPTNTCMALSIVLTVQKAGLAITLSALWLSAP